MRRSARSASRLLWLLTGVVALLMAGGFLLWEVSQLDLPTPRSMRGSGIFRVAPGASLRSVASALADSGWVRHPRLLGYWAAHRGLDRSVYPGRYRLRRGITPREVILEIASGRVESTRVTIPEGWRETQVLRLLADSLEIPLEELADSARDMDWILSLGVPATSLEGYLFPETYELARGVPARDIARMMVDHFLTVWGPIEPIARERGLSMREVVVLASLIEKETGAPEERPLIAAVFLNRLRRGMRLETDPAVIYGIADFDGNLRRVHLQDASNPYNTYQHAGLPPGPIANPGAFALRAVVEPATADYLYFVAKKDGTHQFSRTYGEHVRAVNRFQRNGR